MPSNLVKLRSLTLSVLDELNRLIRLQHLLKICLEQFDHPTDQSQDRVDLLIEIYLAAMELQTDEMEAYLGRIQKIVVEDMTGELEDTL